MWVKFTLSAPRACVRRAWRGAPVACRKAATERASVFVARCYVQAWHKLSDGFVCWLQAVCQVRVLCQNG